MRSHSRPESKRIYRLLRKRMKGRRGEWREGRKRGDLTQRENRQGMVVREKVKNDESDWCEKKNNERLRHWASIKRGRSVSMRVIGAIRGKRGKLQNRQEIYFMEQNSIALPLFFHPSLVKLVLRRRHWEWVQSPSSTLSLSLSFSLANWCLFPMPQKGGGFPWRDRVGFNTNSGETKRKPAYCHSWLACQSTDKANKASLLLFCSFPVSVLQHQSTIRNSKWTRASFRSLGLSKTCFVLAIAASCSGFQSLCSGDFISLSVPFSLERRAIFRSLSLSLSLVRDG